MSVVLKNWTEKNKYCYRCDDDEPGDNMYVCRRADTDTHYGINNAMYLQETTRYSEQTTASQRTRVSFANSYTMYL